MQASSRTLARCRTRLRAAWGWRREGRTRAGHAARWRADRDALRGRVMNQRLWALGVLLALSACAGAERNAAFRATETQLFATRRGAAVFDACRMRPCMALRTPLCRSAFVDPDHARRCRYDRNGGAVSGRRSVSVGLRAALGGTSVIRLKAMCKGMYDSDGGPGWRYDACATKILDIERGFRSYAAPARSSDAPTAPVVPR